MLPLSDPSSGSNNKKHIRLTDEQTHRMMDIFGDPVIAYTAKFSIWTRRKPRYHPLFGTQSENLKDVEFFGIDFRPQAKTDVEILQKASRFIWHHKDKVPQPALLKAWMEDQVDIDGNSLDENSTEKLISIFPRAFSA